MAAFTVLTELTCDALVWGRCLHLQAECVTYLGKPCSGNNDSNRERPNERRIFIRIWDVAYTLLNIMAKITIINGWTYCVPVKHL